MKGSTFGIGGEKRKKKEIFAMEFQIEKTKIVLESDYLQDCCSLYS